MTLSSDISTTSTALSDIKNAIIAKGVTPTGNITTYAAAIANIPAVDFTQYTKYYDIIQTEYNATDLAAAEVIYSTGSATEAIGSGYTNLIASNAEVYIGVTTNTYGFYARYYAPTTVSFPKLKYILGGGIFSGTVTYQNTSITGMLEFPELVYYIGNSTFLTDYLNNITGLKVPKLVHAVSTLTRYNLALKYVNASSYKGDFENKIAKNVIGNNCTNMECLILGDIDEINNNIMVIQVYSNFTTYVFNVTKVPTLGNVSYIRTNTTQYPNFATNGSGKIYVPDNLVDAFKAATNWSTFEEFIKPMSQFVNTWES